MNTTENAGFDTLPILAELRVRLNEHYRASTAKPKSHPRFARPPRWRPLALIVVLVVAGGTTGGLAAAGVFESSSVIQRSNKYIVPAVLRAISAVCTRRSVPATTTAAPPTSLLSILGVLRRPEAPGGIHDVLSESTLSVYADLYVNYVRFARTIDGYDWYVSVSAGVRGMAPPAHIDRCIAAQTANFDRELPRIPEGLRADATQIFDADISTERIHDAEQPQITANLNGISEYGGGGPGGDTTAAAIENGNGLGYGGLATGLGLDTSSVEGLVPDGVASVILHYDAGPVGGYSHKHTPAANVTTTPVNNVIVATVPRAGGNEAPQTIIWRAANGKIVKTIHLKHQ